MQSNGLFSRYFKLFIAMLLCCIAVLGMLFLAFASRFFRQDKLELLGKNAHQAASLTMYNLQSNRYEYVDPTLLHTSYTILGTAVDAQIFLINPQGKTLLCTEEEPCLHTAHNVTEAIIADVTDGEFREVGRFGGVYKSLHYTVGVPLHSAEGTLIGAVFVSTNAQELTRFLTEMLKVFLFSAVLVSVISFIMVYFVTRRLITPLEQMVHATQSFSKGDFTTRVPVSGYDEIGKLAMAFNNMASSLATQDYTRRSFIANVSHELKTPMTTISGFIDGMLDGTITDERRPHYLGIVSDEVKRLSRVVQSMMDIAKIEAGEMSIHPSVVDINDIVCRVVFSFESAIEQKQLEIRGLDTDKVMVNCDADLVYQVIYNMVDNAVKFVNEGGFIEFNYRAEGVFTFTSVKNSGEGISSEDMERIFERFYKTDKSRSLDKNGVGLGLHIARSIVHLHSGEVSVKSEEGQYTEFTFSLPSAELKQPATARFFKDKPKKQLDSPENS